MKRALLIISIIAVSLFSFQNCSKVTFDSTLAQSTPDNNGASGTGDTGGTPPDTPSNPPVPTPPPNPNGGGGECDLAEVITRQTQFLKVIFLVDTSGSNLNTFDSTHDLPLLPTDPDDGDKLKPRRMAALTSLTQRYPAGNKLHYGLVTFGTKINYQNAASLIVAPNGTSGEPGLVAQGLEYFRTLVQNPHAGTPYEAALDKAHSMIAADLDQEAQYYVIMIADGHPSGSDSYETMRTKMKTRVENLTKITGKKVTFNTVYYYNDAPIPNAQNILSEMAKSGGGVAITASRDHTIDLPTELIVRTEICQ